MTQANPEDVLSGLTPKPPSAQYQSRAQAIIDAKQTTTMARTANRWPMAMAAALFLSLVLNVVQFQQGRHLTTPVTGQQSDTANLTSLADAQKPSAGYSYMTSDASPDGQHQSVTVIWENKS